MISAIVAVNNDWGIGFNGDLLEHIPEDLKYFKQLTTGHIVVMGRKTWDSLPKKPLPDRLNVVISHKRSLLGMMSFSMPLEETKARMLGDPDAEYFIIGGGQIYKELLPYCDRVYVTKVNKSHENVDTYFPNLDESDEWAPASCSPIYDYKDLTYQFWQYDRV